MPKVEVCPFLQNKKYFDEINTAAKRLKYINISLEQFYTNFQILKTIILNRSILYLMLPLLSIVIRITVKAPVVDNDMVVHNRCEINSDRI